MLGSLFQTESLSVVAKNEIHGNKLMESSFKKEPVKPFNVYTRMEALKNFDRIFSFFVVSFSLRQWY